MSATAKSKNALANVIVGLLVVMAITLATASTIHFGVAIAGVDDPFPDAALPEAIISGVVLAGAAAAALRISHAWGWALAATLFAILGFLVGLRFTLFGGRSVVLGDVVYHLSGLLVLVVIAGLLLSERGRAALGKDAGTLADAQL
jgi:hypothetical protein